ncbi:MAG: glycoside hydrolase family 95 protein [Verrucomicrobia bacterium]|nr:glycoside hydrolase family 95 protein [Prolixibacteraceae bacterium]
MKRFLSFELFSVLKIRIINMKHLLSIGSKKTTLLLGCILLSLSVFSQPKQSVMWFDKPAYQPRIFTYQAQEFTNPFHFEKKGWFEALPVGNGRLGAMVFGGVNSERIQLNEESLWGGYQRETTNPLQGNGLAEVQRLLFEGKIDSAQLIASKKLMGIPLRINPYQSLGDLFIENLNNPEDSLYTGYIRRLSLDSALNVTQYTQHGIKYRREVFASHPANIIVVKISCDKPKGLNLRFRLTREIDAFAAKVNEFPSCIALRGRVDTKNDKGEDVGMYFNTYVNASTKDGVALVDRNGMLTIKDASEIVLHIAAATSYAGNDPEKTCLKTLTNTAQIPVQTLFQAHLADYQSLYNRLSLNISPKADPYELPQDLRLKRVAERDFHDPYLSQLLFQYGRYLLIACSRKGDLAANLQGIWNQSVRPPWSSDYHTNINLQMNYMGAEAANLADCTYPLYDLMDSLAIHGSKTAKKMYNAKGWVVHHLTDVFWRTTPADGVVGIWPMGSGWLAHHPFDHYLFSSDTAFLRKRAYPLMKGAAEFYLDFLKPIPQGLPNAGMLVTNPSHSPENAFERPDGTQFQFTYGASMDMQIIHELFSNCIQAINILSTRSNPFEPAFKAKIEATLKRLAPFKISPSTGGIQEWVEDYKEPEIGHRHVSHLYALFPGSQINSDTPELYAAARKTLERRLIGNPNAEKEEARNKYKSYGSYLNGKSFGGWQSVWISMMWLRLGKAEQAYEHLHYQLKYGLNSNFFGWATQLDSNFGSTAVIADMLVQSHTGTINILPALPKLWDSGSVTGLRARGGFEVDVTWQNNKATYLKITSAKNNKCKLQLNGVGVSKVISSGKEIGFKRNNQGIEFATAPGRSYEIIVKSN